MSYADWTDKEWGLLTTFCRQDGINLPREDIRRAAWGYMHNGADRGGNAWGFVGVTIALNVDRVQKERHALS